MRANRPHLSVVIPVYRSEKLLARTVNELIETLRRISHSRSCSSTTEAPTTDHGRSSSPRRSRFPGAGLRLYKNHGQHHAVLAGMSVATGDWVVTIDDDGQNPPSEIKALMDDADGHDVVFGRFREKQAHWDAALRDQGGALAQYQGIRDAPGLPCLQCQAHTQGT